MNKYTIDEIVFLAVPTLLISFLTVLAFSWTWVVLVK
jgi:hypothetical protein